MQSTESLKNMGTLKTLTLGPDFRSPRGMYLRGKAVYKGVRHASKSGPTGVPMVIRNMGGKKVAPPPNLAKVMKPLDRMGAVSPQSVRTATAPTNGKELIPAINRRLRKTKMSPPSSLRANKQG
jgi:hypothetical protein